MGEPEYIVRILKGGLGWDAQWIPFDEYAEPFGGPYGCFISEDGLILTAYHVINILSVVWVHCTDGTIHPASIVATDPLADLAVLRVVDADVGAWLPVCDASHDVRRGRLTIHATRPWDRIGLEYEGVRHSPYLGEFTAFSRDGAVGNGLSGAPVVHRDRCVMTVHVRFWPTGAGRAPDP